MPYTYTELNLLKNGLLRAINEDSQGVIDRKGKVVIPVTYQYLNENKNGDGYFVKQNNKWGMINLKNEVLIPVENDSIAEGADGSIWIHSSNGWKKKQ